MVEDGQGLIWNATQGTSDRVQLGAAESDSVTSLHLAPTPDANSYTPPHLVEKILTSHSALQGERKQVTVLFCDLANSTGLAEQLGPEVMHTVLNQFFELALGAIHRYEGTVNQFLGDGFMALFGAPIAHEDHARRAVLAALELRRNLLLYNASSNRPHDMELAVRMGLNTGQVVVGAIGDNLRMDYTAVGDTTNVAARLEHAAKLNQIVISESTHRLVVDYCTTRELGAFALKGKSESVTTWEVLSAQSGRSRLDAEAERGLSTFTGRGQELQILQTCFARVEAGDGQVVLIAGEAGIGKSRLVFEFRQQLSASEVDWFEGRALSFGQSMAFHPVIDLLKRYLGIEDGDSEADIIEKLDRASQSLDERVRESLPYLRYLLAVDPGDEAVQRMDPQLRRAGLFDALQLFLLSASAIRPLILVLEDLHWQDQATEDFLASFIDSLPTSRVLCLLTYRPGYTPPFGERTYHTRLALSALSQADSLQMAQSVLAIDGLPPEMEMLLLQKAEGNPFFVEEVVKSLQETDALRYNGGQLELTVPLEALHIPDTIQDILMARLDRLDEAAKHTLQLASVIGREFTYQLLERLISHSAHLDANLQELKAIELIYEKSQHPELAYMFKHALTQDVAYHSLLTQRQQELHRLIGQAIEELYVDRIAEHEGILAYHFTKGQAWSKALDYLCKAAGKAASAFAIQEALALYDQALEAVACLDDVVDVKTVMAIYQAKGELHFIRSEFQKAREENRNLLRLAQRSHDRISEGFALATMGHASLRSHNFNQALSDAQQAIEIASEVDAQPVLAAAHLVIARVNQTTGQAELAKPRYYQVLDLSRASGDVTTQALTLLYTSLHFNWEGDFAEAKRLQAQALGIARDHNLLFPLLQSFFIHGMTLTGKGEYDQALALFKEGLILSEKVGNEDIRHRLLNSAGWLYSECGHLSQALDFNQQSLDGARNRGDRESQANAELNLSDIMLAQGEVKSAEEVLEGVHHLVQEPKTSEWMKWRYSTHLFASLGELWLARGDLAQAHAQVDQCVEMATRTHSQKYVVRGYRLRGEIAHQQHRWDEAENWLRQSILLARSVGNPTQLWKTYVAMGHLYQSTKQSARAQEYYQAACDVIYRMKVKLRDAELRESLEQSPVIRQVYDFRNAAT